MYEDLDQLVPIKKRLRIYSGSSNPKLAADIAGILGVEVDGLVLEQFANGEIYARFDETVRGCDVFFVQSIVGKNVSDMLGCDLAIAHKGRPHHNQAEVMGIIGDIKGKTCIINDDMIDTAGTLCAAIRELKAMGAGDIHVCATHGIFSGPAVERLNDAPIEECVVTDSVPQPEENLTGKINTISVANEIAECIYHVFTETSVSGMVGGRFNL